MANAQELLKRVKGEIKEVGVDDVKKVVASKNGTVLVDVREREEWTEGFIPGAKWIPRGYLELRIEEQVPDKNTPVVLYCAGGSRSAFAARSLRELGYDNVASMAGGFAAWKRSGADFDKPFILTPKQVERYSRHTMLPEVGEEGQIKLLKSRVLCIGAGGLGSPSALYLAAAGVGTLGMIDNDVVDESNLQRQIIHANDRVGLPKVESAAMTIAKLNADVKVVPHQARLTRENVMDIMSQYDVIVDGADNFQTRYLLNDAALKLNKPIVHASIYRFEGQVTCFIPDQGPCYRCLYPSPPPPDMAPSCQEAGVLGVLCGIIGSIQVNEAIKIILGKPNTLAGRLLIFDALKTKFRELKLRRDPNCPTCGPNVDRSKIELIDYDQFCAIGR
jgi:molybdopterin/thiamine biosynthesis adenylyltransferase/rhodanese-related sulfurtransferase